MDGPWDWWRPSCAGRCSAWGPELSGAPRNPPRTRSVRGAAALLRPGTRTGPAGHSATTPRTAQRRRTPRRATGKKFTAPWNTIQNIVNTRWPDGIWNTSGGGGSGRLGGARRRGREGPCVWSRCGARGLRVLTVYLPPSVVRARTVPNTRSRGAAEQRPWRGPQRGPRSQPLLLAVPSD